LRGVYGIVSFGGGPPRVAWRDGDEVVDLSGFDDTCARTSLNAFMALGPDAWRAARDHDGPRVSLDDVATHMPFEVADYVDFYSSLEHATNIGRLFRPDQEPLPPAWRSLPIGYHGRAGTVVSSGTPVRRPAGQRALGDFGPTRKLDFELELGFVVGVPADGPLAPDDVERHVFGVVLVNDWSARDIQAFEYVPLGPFLGKSFQTSISAWVTPLDELQRTDAPPQDPEPLPHLRGGFALDIPLTVELNGETISRGNARTLYWTMPQQLAHATSNGATIRTGDLMASGTISGPTPGSEGSLIELAQNTRFLADGDEVVLRGQGLAEVRGQIVSQPSARA
jgi:fumarylacetoacetase